MSAEGSEMKIDPVRASTLVSNLQAIASSVSKASNGRNVRHEYLTIMSSFVAFTEANSRSIDSVRNSHRRLLTLRIGKTRSSLKTEASNRYISSSPSSHLPGALR